MKKLKSLEEKPELASVICHIQIDMTTLNHAFFLVMMGSLDTAFKTLQYIAEVILKVKKI